MFFFWLFWFQCDMKKNGCFGVFFFWGGVWFARMGGWIYFDVFDDVFEFAHWMFLGGSW